MTIIEYGQIIDGELWQLITEGDDLAVLRSTESEKYIVADSLLEIVKDSQDEYSFRNDVIAEVNDRLTNKIQNVYDDYDEAFAEMQSRTEQRNATESPTDKAYREYLNTVKQRMENTDEYGEDWLQYANDKESFLNDLQELGQTTAADATQVAKKKPVIDIHETYVNEKNYLKNTPLNLRTRKQYMCWHYELDDSNEWKKIPKNPNNGGNGSSVAPRTWADFDTACKAVDKYGFDGIGIVITNGLVGIDIDHCFDEAGNISERAKEVIEAVNSYTEYSPSGQGIHILAFGKFDGTRTRRDEFEMYQKGRFLTLTGKPFEGKFRKIPKAEVTQPQLTTVYKKFVDTDEQRYIKGTEPVERQQLNTTDEKIIEKCRKCRSASRFEKLWNGDTSLYLHSDGTPDLSKSDSALIGIIAYYTGDKAQIDRIYRQSRLFRPKWDEQRGGQTYGERTIDAVLQSQGGNVYNPKYYYETKIKPKIEQEKAEKAKNATPNEWTTIKMPKDTYVKDVGIGKMFSVQGAKFSYSGKLITETQEGYNLKVHSSFRFRVKQDGERGFDLSVDQLRQALAGEPIATFKQQQQQKNQQITFD